MAMHRFALPLAISAAILIALTGASQAKATEYVTGKVVVEVRDGGYYDRGYDRRYRNNGYYRSDRGRYYRKADRRYKKRGYRRDYRRNYYRDNQRRDYNYNDGYRYRGYDNGGYRYGSGGSCNYGRRYY